jgi:CheY-like chemotaxis protein
MPTNTRACSRARSLPMPKLIEPNHLGLQIRLRCHQRFHMTSVSTEIFYVDDSPDDLFLANYQMRDGEFSFVLKTFSTGIAAIMDMERRAARGETLPLMLVADYYMPITDGPELFRLIRANRQLAGVLLASCSGGDDPRDRQAAQEAGADFILGKPLDLAVCQELISRREMA